MKSPDIVREYKQKIESVTKKWSQHGFHHEMATGRKVQGRGIGGLTSSAKTEAYLGIFVKNLQSPLCEARGCLGEEVQYPDLLEASGFTRH